ncbi:MAG TPA: hypothetical protein VK140_10070 [Ktedonobacteraceae bacterium]|nr:hypothetical protein [Ktedonobacteraceae bacterium]
MQQQALPRSGSIALRQGLIFGVGLGIIQAVITIISNLVNLGSFGIILSAISIILAIAAYLVAGLRASQQTGKVVTGLLAGLWTGLFAAIISYIVTLIITIANIDSLRIAAQRVVDANHANFQYTNSLLIAITAGTGLGVVLFLGLAGLGVGSIGGAIGSRRANIPTQSYQEAMFQPPPPYRQ